MNKENCLNIFERYILGEATVDEISQLKSFLGTDKKLNRWLEREVLSSSNADNYDVKMRMLENIRSQTDYTRKPPVHSYKSKNYITLITNIAAILLPIVVILGIYLFLKPDKTEAYEVAANYGEKASLTLPEGSKIALNSGSKLVYYNDYNKKNREIQLNGEAFFDVSQDKNKPFIVHCNNIKIRVLGTKFGIKAYENEENIVVVLNSGKIQLITPKEEIKMNPNERIVYNKHNQTTSLEKVNAEDYTDWRQNRFRFENEKLETIVKTISRIHNIDIVFENPHLKVKLFTGTIDNTNLERALEAIELTSSISYRMENGTIYLYEE